MGWLALSARLFGVASVFAAAATFADPQDCTVRPSGPPVLGITTPCETTTLASQGFRSDYFTRLDQTAFPGFRGFPSNLALAYGPAAPSLPPLHADVAESASPLMPARSSHFQGPMNFASRVTVAGSVDAVTGSPLLQASDLELPFGGAVYRHTRTYFEPPSDYWHENEPRDIDASTTPPTFYNRLRRRDGHAAAEMLADWHGQGWMIGEAPEFLFDACQLGIGALPETSEIAQTATRYCYFMPDAHHAIPFERQSDGTYVAPPTFDGVLRTRGGTFNSTSKTWTTLPTGVEIWLHNGTVHYTLTLDASDVPSGWHDSPFATPVAGEGVPLRGRVTSIADRWGNRVQIEYASQVQTSAEITETNPPCYHCHQDSPKKGQIARITLTPANASTPQWSLLFTHRSFMDNRYWSSTPSGLDANGRVVFSDAYTYSTHRQLAIHTIHAYPGDVGSTRGAVTITPETYWAAAKTALTASTSSDAIERAKVALIAMDSIAAPNLPTGWIKEARYLYADPMFACQPAVADLVGFDFARIHELAGLRCEMGSPDPNQVHAGANTVPRLLKVTRTKTAETNSPAAALDTVYRYDHPKIHAPEHWLYDNHVLWGVFNDADIAELAAGIGIAAQTWPSDNPCFFYKSDTKAYAYDALAAPLVSRIAMVQEDKLRVKSDSGPLCDRAVKRLLGDFASVAFYRKGLLESENIYHPATVAHPGLSIRPYLSALGAPVENELAYVRGGGVQAIRIPPTADRKGRVFVTHRYFSHPAVAAYVPDSSATQFERLSAQGGGDGILSLSDPFGAPAASWPVLGRSLLHYPYCVALDEWAERATSPFTTWSAPRSADKTTWYTLILEYEFDEAAGSASENPMSCKSARIVEMNAAGLVLAETTWDQRGVTDPTSIAGPRVSERSKYDSYGRLVEHRTAGWSAVFAQSPSAAETQGLIYCFGYTDPPSGAAALSGFRMPAGGVQPTSEPLWKGFKLGASASKPITLLERRDPLAGNRNLAERTIQFATPRPFADLQNAPAAGDLVTDFVHTAGSGGTSDPVLQDMYLAIGVSQPSFAIAQTSIATSGEPVSLDDGAPSMYLRTRSTTAGGAIERASSASFAASASPLSTDQMQRVSCRTQNSDATVTNEWSETAWPPTGFNSTSVRQWPTQRNFDSQGRPLSEQRPDDTRTSYAYGSANDPADPQLTLRVTFSDVDTAGIARSPVQRDILRGATVERTDAYKVTSTVPSSPTTSFSGDQLWTKLPTRDVQGRVTELTILGPQDPAAPSVPPARPSMQFDAFGHVVRMKTDSGNIVRTVYDTLGRPERIFRGTNDQHEVWGTTDPVADPCTASYPDNMALVERRVYGSGPNDSGQLTETHKYRSKPTNQYRLVDCPNTPASNELEIGIVERTAYDQRMRPVATSIHATPASPPSRLTLTWLDNQDRERFTAVFAAEPTALAASIDPRAWNTTEALPSAAQILAASPLVLTETLYDGAGRPTESRSYDVSVAAGTAYTATITRFDPRGNVIWQREPNGRTTATAYDLQDRPTVVKSLAGTTELTRTTTSYDAKGDATEVETLVRTHDGTGATLTAGANAVRTRTFNWYDSKHQLIATAELGTETSDDTFGPSTSTPLNRTALACPATYHVGRLVGFTRTGGLDNAIIRCFEYDLEGRQIGAARSDGNPGNEQVLLDRTEYDALGRVTKKLEDALSTSGKARFTAYQYDELGRMSKIGAQRSGSSINWSATNGSMQITQLIYGAPMTNEFGGGFSPALTDPDQVAEIRFPNPSTGQPAAEGLSFAYMLTGELAHRWEQRRGVKVLYEYDERSNVVRIGTDRTSNFQWPSENAVDQVQEVLNKYDALDRLRLATLYTEYPDLAQNGTALVAQNQFDYDGRGNLVREWQSHGAAVNTDVTPSVQYVRQFASASGTSGATNLDRLTSMVYPRGDLSTGPPQDGRTIGFGYGTAGSIDDTVSRIASVTDSTRTSLALAQYLRAGDDRRVQTTLGVGASSYLSRQTVIGTGASYPSLDRFGRYKKLEWKNAAGTVHYRAQTAYRRDENRAHEQITQANHDNDRSWLYDYDNLSRLVRADRGELSGSLTVITDPPSSHARGYQWRLDPLGNWDGGGSSVTPGLAMSGIPDGSGGYQTVGITHATDAFNALTGIKTKVGSGSPTTDDIGASPDGAITFDAGYVYQYDLFGRLVQVNRRESNGDTGPWVKHYTYDALGRLIRTQTPYPTNLVERLSFNEHFYYDGDRRIQHVATGVQLDPETGKPIYIKDEVAIETVIARDYVWDPDGGDSLIAQFDTGNALWFAISSLSGDAAALMSESGAVVAQYAFDPYGNVLDVDSLASHAPLWIGHKGLFFDRLDQPLSPNRLAAGAEGHYYNRARTYAPKLGRFMQADPNASGLPVRTNLIATAAVPQPRVRPFDINKLFMDGMSIHTYVGSRPTMAADPTGLVWWLPGPTTLVDMQTDEAQRVLEIGNNLRDFITNTVAGYAISQELDFDWAGDWSATDEDYSKSAINSEYYDLGNRYMQSESGPAMAGLRPGEAFPGWVRKVVKKGTKLHHIATPYGAIGKRLRNLFRSAGMKLGDLSNMTAMLKHSGPHNRKYHAWVESSLQKAIKGCKTKEELREAIRKALDEMHDAIRKNPALLDGVGL